MNVIIIMIDSLRWDHVGVYNKGKPVFEGIEPCKTPHIDRFAEKCIVFHNGYPEGLPTIPARITLMTGQATLHCRGWEPLKDNDIPIQTILGEKDYVSGLISDVYHYRASGMNFHRDFDCYRWVRGQEYDPWVSSPPERDLDDYVNENYPLPWRRRIEQFLANTDDFKSEEDWFPAKVFDEASTWLRKNKCHKNKFLWIDNFDPHEPWDPPKRWDTYTNSSYKGKRLIMPMGGSMVDWASDEEIQFMRGLYAGETSFVDHCIGKFFNCLEEEGYLEDSFILLVADHGHPLGDHGKFLKGTDRMYSELFKVPFLVHLPGSENAGLHTDALVCFQDLLPTIMDLIGDSGNKEGMHGTSFLPVLKGNTNEHRSAIVSGYFPSSHRCIRDKRWSYILRPEGEPDELYDLINDPREISNLIDEKPDVVKDLVSKIGTRFFREEEPKIWRDAYRHMCFRLY